MKHKRKKTMPVEYIFCWIGANESVVDSICPKLGMALGKQKIYSTGIVFFLLCFIKHLSFPLL